METGVTENGSLNAGMTEKPENPAVLSIDRLTKSFGKLRAVDDLTMHISAGEAVAFIGQNGAGKSTTMRAIAGLTKLDAGSVSIMGCDTVRDPLSARKHLGYVSQDLALNKFLTGEEFLTLAGRLRGMTAEAIGASIEFLLDLCDLGAARRRMIREYSGGMARKMAMAGALIGNPELVVLDESFVGLDPESTFKIGNYLKSYAENGGAILISSHILDMLYRMCSRFFILHRGKCVADASRAEIDEIFRSGETPNMTAYYLKMTGQAALIEDFRRAMPQKSGEERGSGCEN